MRARCWASRPRTSSSARRRWPSPSGSAGLAIFPLRFGAAATLLENASPPNMIEIIQKYRATVCFTAPTAYRVMLRAMDGGRGSVQSCAPPSSAGETLPAPVYDDWIAKTGKPMLDGIGATEMLHIFITNRFDDHRPACTGRPVTGYEARVDRRRRAARCRAATVGRLAVRGPTGCRYLADDRQAQLCRRTAGTSPATASRRTTDGVFPLRRPQRRHDRVVGLQHRRARGRGGAAGASRSSPNAR